MFQLVLILTRWGSKMILSDKRILDEIDRGSIVIEPFRRECLGTNSYDVHLGKHLATYRDRVLDAKLHNEVNCVSKYLKMDLFITARNPLPGRYTRIYRNAPACPFFGREIKRQPFRGSIYMPPPVRAM